MATAMAATVDAPPPPPPQRALVGRRVRKSFGARVFWGSVVGCYALGGGVFYKVSFDDGDVDVLPAGEALADAEQARRFAREDAGDRQETPLQAELRRASLKRKRGDGSGELRATGGNGGLRATGGNGGLRATGGSGGLRVRVWGQRLHASIYTSVDHLTYIKEFLRTDGGGEGELEASGLVSVGDCVVAVNGQSTEGLTSTQVSNLIRSSRRPMWLTFVRGNGAVPELEDPMLHPGAALHTKRESPEPTATSHAQAASESASSSFARVEAAAEVRLDPVAAQPEPPVATPQPAAVAQPSEPIASPPLPLPTTAAPEPAAVNAIAALTTHSMPPAPTTSPPSASSDPVQATTAPATTPASIQLHHEEKVVATTNDKMVQLREALIHRQAQIRQDHERMQQQLLEMGSNLPTRGANDLSLANAYQTPSFSTVHAPAQFVQQRAIGTLPQSVLVPVHMRNSFMARPTYAAIPNGGEMPMHGVQARTRGWRVQQSHAIPTATTFVSYPQQHQLQQQQQQQQQVRARSYSHLRRFDRRTGPRSLSGPIFTSSPGQSTASSVEDPTEAEVDVDSDIDADAAAIAALGDTSDISPSKGDGSSFLSPSAAGASEMTSFISPSVDTATAASSTTEGVVMSDTAVVVTIRKHRLLVTLGTMGSRVGVTAFVQDHNGNIGEIEESGKVIVGDIIVAVNNMRVKPHTPPSILAHIVNTSPRPLVLAFERAGWDILMNQN